MHFYKLAVHVIWLHSYIPLSSQVTSNLDEKVQKMAFNYPYIPMVEGESSLQFLVVAERIVISSESPFIVATTCF